MEESKHSRYFKPYQEVTPAGNGSSNYIWRGNSIFDPDYSTGAGSVSAMQMIQMGAAYTNYRVLGSKINIKGTMIYSTAAIGRPSQLYLVPTPDDSGDGTPPAIPDWETAEMYPYKKRKSTFSNGSSATTSSYLGTSVCNLKHYMKSKKMVRDYNDTDASGLTGGTGTGTNPVLQWFWQLFIKNNDNNAAAYKFQVDITYYVLFFNRRPIDGGQETF